MSAVVYHPPGQAPGIQLKMCPNPRDFTWRLALRSGFQQIQTILYMKTIDFTPFWCVSWRDPRAFTGNFGRPGQPGEGGDGKPHSMPIRLIPIHTREFIGYTQITGVSGRTKRRYHHAQIYRCDKYIKIYSFCLIF